MGTRVHGSFKAKATVEHELFESEDRASAALAHTLAAHRQRGRVVTEKVDGTKVRFEVSDQSGFAAVHWLSAHDERGT